MTTPAQRKGSGFERELADHFNQTLGLQSFRAPLSGGGTISPIGGTDILGLPFLFVEAKRVERLNFHDAMRQAVRNKTLAKTPDIPIVINRRNRQTIDDSLVVLRLSDFLKLYRHLLMEYQT